jgi:hypothetical protein
VWHGAQTVDRGARTNLGGTHGREGVCMSKGKVRTDGDGVEDEWRREHTRFFGRRADCFKGGA